VGVKHIVCYSGGVSSALVGAMVLKKYGYKNTIWLNHVVNAEPKDVERFEKEFAEYHNMFITYANADEKKYPGLTPASVVRTEKAFAVRHAGGENVLCTTKLKTDPFHKWLKEKYQEGDVIYYGFDANETNRIQRRSSILGSSGYKSDYPLAFWPNPLDETYLDQIGIKKPMQYQVFKHANCRGCIKGGLQHWLCAYVHDRATYDEFAELEEEIGHTILRDKSLDDLRQYFDSIVKTGIKITEHTPSGAFWAEVRRQLELKNMGQTKSLNAFFGKKEIEETKPCECLI
tara:strand:+ start:693 stop:1556 length:864 start_codon:yes stop_codon:yes gene_type:complete